MKMITVVGARPQFIKAATVSRAIAENNKNCPDRVITERIVHTGQHYDEYMSQVFFDELDIPRPDYNLGVGSGPHGQQTGQMIKKIEQVLLKEKPNCVFVHGDTNSTLAGALAAAKLHIPVAHVEAGLRSFNRRMPEEINRVLVDNVSDFLFCPTETAVNNLASEGISKGVHLVGDVMYDSILYYEKKVESIQQKTLKRLNIRPKSYYLATVHRAENTDDALRLSQIAEAFNEIASADCPVILPLHPRTVGYARKYGLEFASNVKVVQPVSYLEMVVLVSNARIILTDSGGVQKEAYFFGVSCITLRDETEWVETVESGWNTLVGTNKHSIIGATRHVGKPRIRLPKSIYGNGDAANRISKILRNSQTASG